MKRSCSCKFDENIPVGVHAVKSVASRIAIPSVLKKALNERVFRAGREAGFGAEVGSFVDSMFYFMIFPKKQSRKGRNVQFMLSKIWIHICLDAHFTGNYDEF